jgi:putative methionine-R-sulfoxide reductase with GAF domain
MARRQRNYKAIAARIDPVGTAEQRMRAVVDALWTSLRELDVSWVGFYLDQPGKPDDQRLALGACRDTPACSPIGLHGVCGQSLVSGKARIVKDVAELGADYIACDPRDRSEVVVPLIDREGRCWAVLDLDSHSVGAFTQRDADGLTAVLRAAGLLPPQAAAPA